MKTSISIFSIFVLTCVSSCQMASDTDLSDAGVYSASQKEAAPPSTNPPIVRKDSVSGEEKTRRDRQQWKN